MPKIKIKNKVAGLKNAAKSAPFDFKFIKILIKKQKDDTDIQEELLDRAWVTKNNNVPHFSNVIKNVDKYEGVEITINCSAEAFRWIIAFVKI